MVISGTFICASCGHANKLQDFQVPPSPYSVPCVKCGEPIIESAPEEMMKGMYPEKENK